MFSVSKGVTFQEVKAKVHCILALFSLGVYSWKIGYKTLTNFIQFQDLFYGRGGAEDMFCIALSAFFTGILASELGFHLLSLFPDLT